MASSASNTIGATLDAADNIVLALGREVNVAFQGRCAITKSECKNLHIDACRSRFPTGECTEEDLPEICTVDGDCGGVVRDMSNPSDRVPTSVATGENMSPSDLSAIETMCYSILLNNQMRAGFDAGAPYGASALYWGAWTGVFRYFPGNAQDVCGDFDPRNRPWFISAGSGPKDVVIVLDVSGSMLQGERLTLAKEEAVFILESLGPDNYVNVVIFSADAALLTEESTNHLVPADTEHLDNLVSLVKGVEVNLADPGTNFGAAMEKTFDLLDATVRDGESSECQTAILFMSDGESTLGLEVQEVIDLVVTRNTNIHAEIFTFSLGDTADKATMKEIACNTNGVYQHVEDASDLSQALAFFERYYATGLANRDDPIIRTSLYPFYTGGKDGFTVASPVYDDTNAFPYFLGVVGIDFTMENMIELGMTAAEVEDALSDRPKGCPFLNLTSCEIEVFRGSISVDSVCSTSLDCSSVGSLEPELCDAPSEYPTDLWQNTDLEGYAYSERACCNSDAYTSDLLEPTCDAVDLSSSGSGSGSSTNVAVAVSLVLLFVIAFTFLLWRHYNRKTGTKDSLRRVSVSEGAGPVEDAPRNISTNVTMSNDLQ